MKTQIKQTIKGLSIGLSLLTLHSCSTVPLTGRSQLVMYPESEMINQANQSYSTLISQQGSKLLTNTSSGKNIDKVADRVVDAVKAYMKQAGLESQIADYNWQFNLIQSPEINAWCMPGGKIAVYTGLLSVTQNDASLACVLGHEIAHAIARHSNERLSQAQGMSLLGQAAGAAIGKAKPQIGQVFNMLYPVGSQVFVGLPNSRKQELEADHMGLIFMAMAGYNPEEAIGFWQRMAAAGGNSNSKSFMSTHPDNGTRVANLKKEMPTALKYYQAAKR